MKKYMILLMLAISAGSFQLLAENQDVSQVVDKSEICEHNSTLNQEVLLNMQATVAENTEALALAAGSAVDLIKENPSVAAATVAGAAGFYGLYKTKNAIMRFVKKHPYSTVSLIALVVGGTGMWWYSIPLKTCVQTTGAILLKGPLMAAQWMQGVMAIKFGFDYAKNIFNEEDEKQELETKKLV